MLLYLKCLKSFKGSVRFKKGNIYQFNIPSCMKPDAHFWEDANNAEVVVAMGKHKITAIADSY